MYYNFKNVDVDLGNGSCFEGEWMYMLKNGKVVCSWELIVADEEDYQAAKSFGWTDDEINDIRIV